MPIRFHGADGKTIRGDQILGRARQILFITGFLSKRWGTKSTAIAQWCCEQGWAFCCYDVRGFGESDGAFTDYTLSDWVSDARAVVTSLCEGGSPITIVGNSLGGWIAWLIAQEFAIVDELILIAPAFNMMGERAKTIAPERRRMWQVSGWMPWDDDPLHLDWPLAWKWVEESEAYWAGSFDTLRHVPTTIVHGEHDVVISPQGSRSFTDELLRRDPTFPLDLRIVPGDHRLSRPEHVELLRRLIVERRSRSV
ncbi:MAG: alpha/beta fold hydrolase [Nitrospiraceae bacterium]